MDNADAVMYSADAVMYNTISIYQTIPKNIQTKPNSNNTICTLKYEGANKKSLQLGVVSLRVLKQISKSASLSRIIHSSSFQPTYQAITWRCMAQELYLTLWVMEKPRKSTRYSQGIPP